VTVLRDVVPDPALIMGAKAVFGVVSSHILCFAGRGDPAGERLYYSRPGAAARRAASQPFILAIGGGGKVRSGFKGRVVNLVRAGTVYGDTTTLLDDPVEVQRLAQWPVAIILHDVWRFAGDPRLVEDLGLPDRRVLEGAVDGVARNDQRIEVLWTALADWPIDLSALPAPANLVDTGVPTLARRGLRPLIAGGAGSREGERVWKAQLVIERDQSLSRDAKQLNIGRYGRPTCEACKFSQADPGMFDAHHPNPLAVGVRTTLPEHLIVLCPTCHRRAHRREKLNPYTLAELLDWVGAGRP
jgi:hypothetical protein